MKRPVVYETLALLFVAVLIVSNIASVKIVSVGNFLFDAGTVLFPVSYIIGDIITEIYGFRRLRSLVLKTGAILLGVSIVFWVIGLLPAASADIQSSYGDILGVVWRIVVASIAGFTLGEIVNGYILASLKIRDRGKKLWNRLIGSSVLGNAVDTSVFTVIAFAGTMPLADLINVMVTVYVIKMAVEIIISPLTMQTIRYIKRIEHKKVYEAPVVW